MPGKSTFSKTQDIIAALCNVDGFDYDESQMWEFLKQTDLKIKEPSAKSSKPRRTTAYSLFLKENKKGMDDTMLKELIAVVAMANETNRLVESYQVEIDDYLK